jgi:PDZ domain-containing protein
VIFRRSRAEFGIWPRSAPGEQERDIGSPIVSRRIAVLASGAVLLLVFGLVGAAVPVPYVAEVPGPTYDTLGTIEGKPIITVDGRPKNQVRGHLNLTTVGVGGKGLSLVEAVRGWFDPAVSIVPADSVYPPDQSPQQTRRTNRDAFLTSEQAAESAALGHLGYPDKVVVQGISDDSPSKGKLQDGDAIDSVDGRPTADTDTLDKLLSSIPGGSTVTVGYTRLGQPGMASITTKPATDRSGSLLGVLVREQPSAPFTVDISVADVGGPSAGLMLTLGILDLVGDTDLTGGRFIAGTGTIDPDGKVGPIGGIPLKMRAAKDKGAQLFLVPAGNCSEAKGDAPAGLPLARVATLDDALTALSDFRAGRTPATC